MRLMTGFYEPDGGAVELNGYDVNRKRLEASSRVAYVPESGALYPEMTVYEYLRSTGRSAPDQPSVILWTDLVSLSKQLELDEVINRKCETLSKGYKRRVGIAGALLHRPRILILQTDRPKALTPTRSFPFAALSNNTENATSSSSQPILWKRWKPWLTASSCCTAASSSATPRHKNSKKLRRTMI